MSATSPAGSAESRATFYPPSAVAGVAGIDELPADNPGSVHANDTARETDFPVASAPTVGRMAPGPIEVDQRTSAVVKTPAQAPVNSGRHEGPQAIENVGVTRSREPRQERSEDVGSELRAFRADARMASYASSGSNRRHPRPNSARDRQEGAFDYAISSHHRRNSRGRCSYRCCDRWRKRRSHRRYQWQCRGLRVRSHDTSQQRTPACLASSIKTLTLLPMLINKGITKRYDRGPSLARRFGTPNFNGR